MPDISVAVTPTTLSERSTRALERLKEVFQTPDLPEGFYSLAVSENGINDLYMNMNRQLADGKLERKTKLLVAAGVASGAGSPFAFQFFSRAAVSAGRTTSELAESAAVASVCTVFNSYYRFRSQLPSEVRSEFEIFRAPFNANTFLKPALPMVEVEAICIAVSSLNHCSKCVEGHIAKARSLGVTSEQIDEIIKAGAVALSASKIASSLAHLPGATPPRQP